MKERHEERRDWKEKQETVERKAWLKEMKMREDGIGGA